MQERRVSWRSCSLGSHIGGGVFTEPAGEVEPGAFLGDVLFGAAPFVSGAFLGTVASLRAGAARMLRDGLGADLARAASEGGPPVVALGETGAGARSVPPGRRSAPPGSALVCARAEVTASRDAAVMAQHSWQVRFMAKSSPATQSTQAIQHAAASGLRSSPSRQPIDHAAAVGSGRHATEPRQHT